MSYMFLSFTDHLYTSSKLSKDMYKDSLEEQFKNLRKRIPSDRAPISFGNFIEACFPSGQLCKYYISCPNFIREKSGNDYVTYLNNVVIRPELTLSIKGSVPDHSNVILIGDIKEGQVLKCFSVKGIQFIDENMGSKNDIVVEAQAVSSFDKNSWTIDRPDYSETLFTENFIADLIASCWTVSAPAKVKKNYDKWQNYLKFRHYYLDKQSERKFVIESAEYLNAYAINKKDYRKNSVDYDDYILEDNPRFKTTDMVVLSKKIYAAEEFPLIRVNFDWNKKEFIANSIKKGGKSYNKEEKQLRLLVKENVFITSTQPKITIGDDGKSKKINYRELQDNGFELGDRFTIIETDVLPEKHLQEIEANFQNAVKASNEDIENRYRKTISDKLADRCDIQKEKLYAQMMSELVAYQKSLLDALEDDVKNNSDQSIKILIKKEKEAIDKIVKSSVKKLEKETDEEYKTRLDKFKENAYLKIDVKQYYENRNAKLYLEKSKLLNSRLDKELQTYKISTLNSLNIEYSDDIKRDQKDAKDELIKIRDQEINKAIDEETIKRFSVYFKVSEYSGEINDKQIEKIRKCKYLIYDNRAEAAKINRQEQALENFYKGFVKNPYLSTYLFSPQELHRIPLEHDTNWHWYLESLNEKQKEAVKKAVYSNGIFLLQGPPGTGKTQVIAEVVAHLVQQNKKVLISSETHKAIDNVFERLPKISDIIPIRLIPSNNDKGKENDYDPKYLVDNFYLNIKSNMQHAINRYKNFKENKEDFDKKFKLIELNKSKLDKCQSVIDLSKKEIDKLEKETDSINKKIESLKSSEDLNKIYLDKYKRTIKHINANNLEINDDIIKDTMVDYTLKIQNTLDLSIFKEADLSNVLDKIERLNPITIEEEISNIDPKSKNNELLVEKGRIVSKLNEFFSRENVDFQDNELKSYQEKLIQINKQIEEKGNTNLNDLQIAQLFSLEYLNENKEFLIENVDSMKNSINDVKNEYIQILEANVNKFTDNLIKIEKDLDDEHGNIRKINEQLDEISDREEYKDLIDTKFKLERDISDFFKDFEISQNYTSTEEALTIIKSKWRELELNFDSKEQENKEKIPMYEKIVRYISSKEVIEDDRKEFTKSLFESANVFGITCTSRDNFKKSNLSALDEYNIDEFDIKKVGIDVVIIDEVSKSSFVDLLIPILYGKTVILVGDHRQLPPMYDLSKLREDDFDELDPEIITYEKNKEFTELYEECFFKTLFEKIPSDYKTMLLQQYRCHGDIMNVFNHFYRNQLKVGEEGQNNKKKHNILIRNNGRTIIEPDSHVYFINCSKCETRATDSTSIFNIGEVEVVVELLQQLRKYYKDNPSLEKCSVGVITTYGDQAHHIKQALKQAKIGKEAFDNHNEKMIISTVDDFQGDERDIIILSTVRNPERPERSSPGFITAYQRINVALSRARKLLIVVGNRNYLQSKGVIDLPDINGDKDFDQKNFRVYEQIIGTIERDGKIIQDFDVVKHKEDKING